jgi:hypothetical protein
MLRSSLGPLGARLLVLLASAHLVACSHPMPESTPAMTKGERPAPLAPGAVRFAVIGDFGNGSADELEVARLVSSWSPAFIVTVGDNNYPDGAAAQFEARVGAAYGPFIPGDHGAYGLGSAVPRFFPTLGNHDWRSSVGMQPFVDYFHTPGNGRYYDVLLADGRVQLFALDADPHEPDGSEFDSVQGRWFTARAAASSACLRIAAFHHAAYSSSEHGSTKRMQWPFRALGMDAVLTGHDHVYERLEVDGIPYFVDGMGGSSLYRFGTPLPQSRARFNARHGAMLVTLSPGETRYEAWSVAGERVDSLTLPNRCGAAAAEIVGTPSNSPAALPR